jgi:hypothetical protein
VEERVRTSCKLWDDPCIMAWDHYSGSEAQLLFGGFSWHVMVFLSLEGLQLGFDEHSS